MAKRPLKLKIRIPPYSAPRNVWRRQLHAAIAESQEKSKVEYRETDRLEVEVLLYMDYQALRFHDVDNRLKDILDALQGRAGGPKNRRTLQAIVPNDRQIFRVIVEKREPPKQSHGKGHLVIRRLGKWRITRRPLTRRSNRRPPASH